MPNREEHILVCVNYGQQGVQLIRRGLKLATQLDAPLTILVFGSLPEDEDQHDKIVGMPLFKQMSNRHGANVIMEKSRQYNVKKIIADRAKAIGATQIIVGQFVESLWRRFLGNTTLNGLLNELSHADVRVIPRSHEHEEMNYEHGVNAFLHANDDGTYDLAFHHDNIATHEGVFYKHIQTDFNNGRFVYYEESNIYEVRVLKGHVPHLENIAEEITS
ncbi:two-component system sensor histidine kinase KdpD [Geomicrobium halophilum]|uniref:Two-component system sensor histidine kinase KdpD n=1 Tax=Geomicrobium halophilum TaxID=549000 RepID=A0A841PVU1_9BACL|nr:universal stress protein UspA [Geomicrobium halophilum]MBB6451346.1 two-component system sensor histidine kinase KdpD [Geomicrobium halophilum]